LDKEQRSIALPYRFINNDRYFSRPHWPTSWEIMSQPRASGDMKAAEACAAVGSVRQKKGAVNSALL
jgi:hypothetical protein